MFSNYLDFFNATTLMDAVAKQPFVPGQLTPLFETRQLIGTDLALEDQAAQGGAILSESSRGVPSKTALLERNKVHTFKTKHYRADGAVHADEVLNARAAGASAVGELVASRRDMVLASMRRDIDATLEKLRVDTLTTPDNAFGSKPADAVVAFQTDATKTRGEIFSKIIKPMEDALEGIAFTGIDLYCSNGIWDDVIENKNIKDTYLYSLQAQAIRGDGREFFSWGGINFIRYRGAGSIDLPANKAIAVPRGVPGMFVQAFAPADTMDSVGAGAVGLPLYVQAYPIDNGNRGWHLEMQTNAVAVCTRPTAVLTVAMA
jgi:hypothetical protein